MPSGLEYMQKVTERLSSEHNMVPSIWMGDEYHDGFAREFFPECDLLDWSKMLDERIEATLSAEEFTLLSKYWTSQDFLEQREALVEEFNRFYTVKLSRSLDREVALRRVQARTMRALLRNKPDFFLASETPHNPVFLSAFFLVKWLDIPTLFFHPTTTVAPALLPKTELGLVFPGPSISDLSTISATRSFISEKMSTALDELTNGISTLPQRDERNRLQSTRTLQMPIHRRIRRALKDALHEAGKKRESRRNPEIKAELSLKSFLDYHRDRLRVEHNKLNRDPSADKFALFAMHFQPERTSVPEGGTNSFPFEDFVRARKLLPSEFSLVIKEHESQISGIKPGHHGRPYGLYAMLGSFPNTQVISGFGEAGKLLPKCSLVFTRTGSIGIEAALQGVPVVYLGNPWWAGTPGTYAYRDLPDEFVLENLKPAPKDEVRKYLSSIIEEKAIVGLGTPSGQEFWDRQGGLPDDFFENAVEQTVETVRLFARENVGLG